MTQQSSVNEQMTKRYKFDKFINTNLFFFISVAGFASSEGSTNGSRVDPVLMKSNESARVSSDSDSNTSKYHTI